MSAERDYFDWRPTPAHGKGCKQTRWEVRERRTDYPSSGREDIDLQLVCPEVGGCGVAITWSFSLAPDKDEESGDPRSGIGYSSGPVAHIGYGVKPVRVNGVWLHSGPPLLPGYGDGPDYYLVTSSPSPPAGWADVLGVIGQVRRHGRQLKGRWFATADYAEGRHGGMSPQQTAEDRTSRTAAVAWVIAQTEATETAEAAVSTLTPKETYL